MRGQIVPADVSLDLNDPTNPSPSGVVADQLCPEQRATGLQGGAGEDRPVEDARIAQRSG